MIFDTHAHYDDEQFDIDREELLGKMETEGIGMIVNAGSTIESWDRIKKLTEEYSFMYGSVGVHPDEVGTMNEQSFQRMGELLDCEKIVAVGEIGLDYYWDKEGHDLQRQWFIRQLELAREKKYAGDHPQQRGCRRYYGNYEAVCRRHESRYPLLLLFSGDGPGICENGILYRRGRCGYL